MKRMTTRAFLSSTTQHPRGSALVMTLLVLLVLTGLGMTALHSVGRSLSQSGTYRVRAQASGLAKAALNYSSNDVGHRAKDYWHRMNRDQGRRMELMDATERLNESRRGLYLRLDQTPGAASRAFPELGSSGTGLLSTGTQNSFESGFLTADGTQPDSGFSMIVRDPIDGPSAVGYATEDFCFKKVTIASRASLGDSSGAWEGAGMVGARRAANESYIGPIPCGAR